MVIRTDSIVNKVETHLEWRKEAENEPVFRQLRLTVLRMPGNLLPRSTNSAICWARRIITDLVDTSRLIKRTVIRPQDRII